MSTSNTAARTLHDLGLATWFGGSLMGAVGLNGASGVVGNRTDRARVADAGWAAWTPVNAAAILAHLAGGAQLTAANKGRVATQQGVASSALVKTALTAGALAATGYARVLGQKLMQADGATAKDADGLGVEVEDGVTPAEQTPPDVAKAQKQIKVLQWVIPVLTGGLILLNADMGEQQRASNVAAGTLRRILPGA